MTPLERRRRVHALGEHAISYYVDTGCCVFCDADDCQGEPHGEGCDVGALSGVAVTPERVAEKRWQRGILDKWARGELTREELYASRPEDIGSVQMLRSILASSLANDETPGQKKPKRRGRVRK